MSAETRQARQRKKRPPRPDASLPVPPSTETYLPTAYVIAGVALLIWVFRYWHCADFGLYEDDYLRIPPAMQFDAADWWRHFKGMFQLRNTQGRPFHEIFLYASGTIAGHWGGLTLMYIIGYLIVTANAVLFYLLLKRLQLGALPALIGVMAFALFPADVVSQVYLTLSHGGQPSILFLLLAAHVYLSGRRWLSLPLVIVPLFGYETVFPLAAAIPLLGRRWDRRLLREFLLYGCALSGLLVASAVLRTSLGAVVRDTPSLREALTWPFQQMALGPITSLGAFYTVSHNAFRQLDRDWLWLLIPLLLSLLLLLDWIEIPAARLARHYDSVADRKARNRIAREYVKQMLRTARTGAILLVLAYPLAFTVPAIVVHGRATRVHMPAVIGASILFACVASLLVFLARIYRGRYLAVAVIVVLLVGMAAVALRVQDDYRASWAYQRGLWHDLVRLCPDVTEDTLILVPMSDLRDTGEIRSWGWYTAEMLEDMFKFPRDWKPGPAAYMLYWNWRFRVERQGNLTDGIDRMGWNRQDPADPQFILLEAEEDGLRRRTGALKVGDLEFQLKEPGNVETMPYERRFLYYLMFPPGEPEPGIRYWR